MAKEKEFATHRIIEAMGQKTDSLITQHHDEMISKLKESIENSRIIAERHSLETLQRDALYFKDQLKSVQAEQRYATMASLLKYRQELLNDYIESLKVKILEFKNSSEYDQYLKDAIGSVSEPILVHLDKSDQSRITNIEVKVIDLPLGGVLVETKDKIYDYSFKTRLNDAITQFQENEALQLRRAQDE